MKLNKRNQHDNSNKEQIIEQVNKQFQAKTMAEIVKQQMSPVDEEKVVKLVESKVEEKVLCNEMIDILMLLVVVLQVFTWEEGIATKPQVYLQ